MQRQVRVLRLATAAALVAATGAGCAADGTTTVAPAATTTTAPAADGSDGGTDTPGPSSTPSPSTTTGGSSVPSALQFSAPGVGGTTIDFAQYAGTPVVLWFWAPG
ncbi:MAG: hypothetical protein ACKO27_08840 [Ilumatobacteraceae bacterium]